MRRSALCVASLLFGIGLLAQGAAQGYHVIKRIPLGGEGGWDYLTVDAQARRLYVSRATHVLVLDVDTEKVVGDIPDTPGVHGIALAPELGRGFISCGKADLAVIFDLKTLQSLGQVKTGANPDAILYDPATKRVFAFNGRGKDVTVFAGATGKVEGTISLDAKPEFAVTDGKGTIYVNLEDKSEMAEIDSAKLSVRKRFALKPGEEPSGLAFDPKRRLLFSGCSNRLMTVLDAQSGKVVATVPIGAGVDGNGFDPELGLAFSSNGEGTLTVAREKSPGRFEAVQSVPTQRGARTLAVDPKTHKIYLPTAEFGPAPAPTPENPRPRPAILKDTFVLIVVGP